MRITLLSLILAALVSPAAAQVPCRGPEGAPEPTVAETAPQPNRFYRVVGKGLACAVSQEDGAAMADRKRPVTFLPCLRVGAVGIADDRAEVEKLLGEPSQISDLDLRTQARVYPIHQRSIPEPYYAVTYQDDVVVAVQLIGPPTEMPAALSGVALGDSVKTVVDVLGKPTRRCMLRAKGPETWMWQPFPIGVDVLDGRVVGLKATWPAGRATPN